MALLYNLMQKGYLRSLVESDKIIKGAIMKEEFTKEVPEDATLLNLAMQHKIKAFQIENINHGVMMVMCYFEHDGWQNLYQDGDSALCKHLFFWLTAWKNPETTPEEVALKFFGDGWILSE